MRQRKQPWRKAKSRRRCERGPSETEHLKRSPANAKRLDEAIAEIAAGKVVAYDPRDPSAPRAGLRRRP